VGVGSSEFCILPGLKSGAAVTLLDSCGTDSATFDPELNGGRVVAVIDAVPVTGCSQSEWRGASVVSQYGMLLRCGGGSIQEADKFKYCRRQ
jgi:hypothetical protein